MKSHRAIRLTCFIFSVIPCCPGADIIFVEGRHPHPAEKAQVERLANFFGLEMIPSRSMEAASQVGVANVVGIVTSADSLPRMRTNLHVPVLIFGVTQTTDTRSLRLWSGNAVESCTDILPVSPSSTLKVISGNPLAGVLAGSSLPIVAPPACQLNVNSQVKTQPVLAVGRTPVLISVPGSETFLMPQLGKPDTLWAGQPSQVAKAFSSMAPFLMFLKYAAADRAWKLDGQYANLTIDDPWLIQPYGHLDYPALLREMERHRFHTTIAFIPWNFERSRPDAVSLFRANPAKYSIAIHGNNHDHQEFGSYKNIPLREQIADLNQAVARMERFHQLTGISYDRFMIFPHSVAPEATFAALKHDGFLGTANSLSVPLGSTFPQDPAFLLRTYTNNYAGILSVFRFPAESAIPETDLTIHTFLGNPLLFYGHESLFQRGIGSFNSIADLVNRLAPDSHWTSLGEISRHLYLQRKRVDHAFDAEMFSSDADLLNSGDDPAVFYVHAASWDSTVPCSLTVNGEPASLQNREGTQRLRVVVAPHQIGRVRGKYQNDLTVDRQEIRTTTLRVRMLRAASDFRDLYLSTSPAGQAISRSYYGSGFNETERYLERSWWLLALCFGLLFAGFRFRRRRLVKQ